MKYVKGSITVEAAIVLPIFILSIMMIAFMMKIYYTKEKVNYVLTQAALNISSAGYLYEKSGLLDIKRDINKKAESSDVLGKISFVATETEIIKSAIFDENGSLNNFQKSFDKLLTGGSLSSLVEGVSDVNRSFQTDILPIYNKGEEIINTIKGLVKNKKDIYATLTDIAYTSAEKYIICLYVDNYLKESLNNDLWKLGIISDFDYEGSMFFYKDSIINIDDLIKIKVKYTMKLPISFLINNEFQQEHEITVRAWTGRKD